ncbi:RNA polymerase sigma factor [Streptomyces zaomyceticus]|uniref:RNA polymerase sigma factor n=1 Tax=Streptomyces zaomyceticus TaxID=68286 RepID=UPI0033A6FC86
MTAADRINEVGATALTGEHAARVRVDAERIEQLAYHHYEGRAYKLFEEELYREVQPVVLGMLRNNSLPRLAQKHCARQGYDLFIHPDDLRVLKSDSTARDTVMVDMVMAALRKLQRDLQGGRGWRADHNGPQGASSLPSYFITVCTWMFGRAYQKWAHERLEWARQHAVYDFTESASGTGIGRLLSATDYVVDDEVFGTDFEEILDEQAPETQAVVRLTVMGFEGAEIADKLNISHGAVRTRLTRFRTALYAAASAGRIWIPKELHTRKAPRQTVEVAA